MSGRWTPPRNESMIDSATAVSLVVQHSRPGPSRRVPLFQALGRTQAADVTCDIDYPPFDRAMMDGFAVRAQDVTEPGTRLRLLGSVAAGSAATRPLGRGESYRINTGAPVPTGATAVVPVEMADVAPGGEMVTLSIATVAGLHVASRSSCARAGSVVLAAGLRIEAAEIATAAAAGATQVTVYADPTVGILATGDELVPIDQRPATAQIRNSNSSMLHALVARAGGEAVDLGIAPDQSDALGVAIGRGLRCDLLCITGGVSMGEHDLVPGCLSRLGCTTHFRRVAIKPGKPTLLATSARGGLVFGLPGNPISAMVSFLLFVEPALRIRQGRGPHGPRLINAIVEAAMPGVGDRESYWPVRMEPDDDGHLRAKPLSWRGSGDPFGVAGANALLVRPRRDGPLKPGDAVKVLPLHEC